ncbi:Protein WEAK CHLOROPLAST MOVEMENT UNDER BLUE LIGHT 1 [Zea mays]|uniref:Protein WEAK CHLOROPLAST MOVEMENT UNDER BLUE LIGHT 1 n=2 Tax=Zea mays TaxID=4577 RepID=A0A1D6GR59_MAIZE|nr:Protein WEAK CHLOROPLAST MOVEMENT UNDER BLUE LIGHT 1 [Zea mays]
MLQEHPMSLVLAENKSNLQEILVEQKIPIGVSIKLSPKVDGSELPCPIEVHDGITSSSSKTNETMEAQDYSNTMKSNTSSCMFEASKWQECPISLILADKKGSLQEVSVEQNVPCGDYVSLSQKADGSELTSTSEAPEGFLTSSSKVYVLKEAQDGSITTEASKVNVCAASHSMLRLIEGVQDEASCIDSDKVTCETPPSILKRLKEDKPLVVHRFHKRQMSLGDTHQKVPAPVSRSNTSKYLRMDKNIVDTTTPIESVNVVASKFGGNMNWKTRKTQTTHASDRIVLELDKMKNKISECKHQAEAAEAAKLSVLKEVERTKKLIDEMKHVLEREQAKEVDAKDDLELFQIISQAMEGVDCNDSVVDVKECMNTLMNRLIWTVAEDDTKVLASGCIDSPSRPSAAAIDCNKKRRRRRSPSPANLAEGNTDDCSEQRRCLKLPRDRQPPSPIDPTALLQATGFGLLFFGDRQCPPPKPPSRPSMKPNDAEQDMQERDEEALKYLKDIKWYRISEP